MLAKVVKGGEDQLLLVHGSSWTSSGGAPYIQTLYSYEFAISPPVKSPSLHVRDENRNTRSDAIMQQHIMVTLQFIEKALLVDTLDEKSHAVPCLSRLPALPWLHQQS